jgi:hypothetical protein
LRKALVFVLGERKFTPKGGSKGSEVEEKENNETNFVPNP